MATRNNIHIHTFTNLFIFVTELAQMRQSPWNIERVQEWTTKTGGVLSTDERNKLKTLSALIQPAHMNLVEACAIRHKERMWEKTTKEHLAGKTRLCQSIIQSFEKRFSALWRQEEPKLIALRRHLLNKKHIIERAMRIVHHLTGARMFSAYSTIPIYLTISSSRKKDVVGWFSRFNNKTDLVLECSGLSADNYLEPIFVHELFHYAVGKSASLKHEIETTARQEQKVLAAISDGMPPILALEELLLSSFVPEGYLSQLFFGTRITPKRRIETGKNKDNFTSTRTYCAYQLREMAQTYINNKRQIDTNYLLSLIDVIKNGR